MKFYVASGFTAASVAETTESFNAPSLPATEKIADESVINEQKEVKTSKRTNFET